MTRATREHRLVIEHLTKKYGDRSVVDDLTFTVEPGRITGFLGPNGSGKSTTMKILLGLAAADHGTATIGGARYRGPAQASQHRRRRARTQCIPPRAFRP